MHELSIAQAIADVATRHARGRTVVKIEVRVGHLRQVVPESLDFAFSLVAQGTALDGAELALTEVPVTVRCRACGAETVPEDFPLGCRRCAALDVELLSGEELVVDALELEDDSSRNERIDRGSHV